MGNLLPSIINTTDISVPIFLIKVMFFITGFFLLAILFSSFLTSFIQFIFADKFDLKVKAFSLFGLTFTKNDNNWIRSFKKISPLCECAICLNIEKAGSKDSLKIQKQFAYLERFISLIIALLIIWATKDLFIAWYKGESLSFLEFLFIGFSIGMLFHSIIHILISIYLFEIMYKGFLGYIQSKFDMIKHCNSFEELDLKPIEELPHQPHTSWERLIYDMLYCYHLLTVNKIEEMKNVSHEMTDILWEKEFLLNNTGAYYWLIFYYSEFEPSLEKAERFRDKAWTVLSKDNEANAKRVLAYYFYRLHKDEKKAKILLDDGLSVIDKYSMGAEREFEKNLLLKLKNEIESKPISF